MATSKKAAPKKVAAPKKTATKKAAPVVKAKAPDADAGPVAQIRAMFAKGKTRSEIVAAGFNKSTVYRQCVSK